MDSTIVQMEVMKHKHFHLVLTKQNIDAEVMVDAFHDHG